MPDERETYDLEKERFESALDFSLRVSVATNGRHAPLSMVLGSYVFTRMCVTAETISHLLDRGIEPGSPLTLDHFSISVLCRNIVEASLMFHYLTEEVTAEQWELRRKVLDLHDSIVRLRLFKGLGDENERKEFKRRIEESRSEIKKSRVFRQLPTERQQKIIGGNELYVTGIRSVVEQLEIDRDYFDAIYNYLSAQVHVSSNTFYYTHKGRIDFETPAAYQFFVSSFAAANARMFLLPAAIRYLSLDKVAQNGFDPKEIEVTKALSKKAFASE